MEVTRDQQYNLQLFTVLLQCCNLNYLTAVFYIGEGGICRIRHSVALFSVKKTKHLLFVLL